MCESRMEVLAIDDDSAALAYLKHIFGDNIHLFHIQGSDCSKIVEDIVELLTRKRPTKIIIDLKWETQATWLDGVRLLRTACELGLFNQCEVIIWSDFLDQLEDSGQNIQQQLRAGGAVAVKYLPKRSAHGSKDIHFG